MKLLDIANRIRQNHALEHATIHVLSRRNPYVRLVGRSSMLSGFVIFGKLSTWEVEQAATEALARLQQGEAHLAVHPQCGTNLAVTGLLVGTAAFAATLGRTRSRFERLPLAIVAATLGAILARPLAQMVQENITTTPEVEGLTLDGVVRQDRGGIVTHKVVIGRE